MKEHNAKDMSNITKYNHNNFVNQLNCLILNLMHPLLCTINIFVFRKQNIIYSGKEPN